MIIPSTEVSSGKGRKNNLSSREYLLEHKRLIRVCDNFIVQEFYKVGYKSPKEKGELYNFGLNQIKVFLGRRESIKDLGELGNGELRKVVEWFRKGRKG